MTALANKKISCRRRHGRDQTDATTLKNLVLVVRPSRNEAASLRQVCGHIRELCSDVQPIIVRDAAWSYLRPRLWMHPKLTISFTRLNWYRPLRGAVRQGKPLRKSQEYRALQRCGIPVPRWALLTENQMPDLSEFGRYVVKKPDFGGCGAEIRFCKKSRVRWRRLEHYRARFCQDCLVQDFIYTGKWPNSYRVLTLFGTALYCDRSEVRPDRPPLSSGDNLKGWDGSIVATARCNPITLADDPDVIALAERAHAAFADSPVLGVDIVREQPTGKLYVLEVNACGQVWHFSSPAGLEMQRDWGMDLAAQFDGLRRAAQVMIDQTRRHAR